MYLSPSFLAQDTLSCKGLEYVNIVLPEVFSQLKRHGHCVIQMWDLTATPLIALRDFLGRGQLHIRAAENGVVTISPTELPNPKLDESHYFATNAHKHPPHTDGAYLSGFVWQNGVFKWIGPPAVVLIQCVRSAPNGGTNIVVDTQQILRDLLTHNPEVAKVLLSPGCVSFCRDDQMVLDTPVYERFSANRWRVRFRSDDALYTAEWSHDAIQHLHDYYLSNKKYQKRIDLQEGQILLLDNFRVLHGREAFGMATEQTRFFRRTWIHDDSTSRVFINFLNTCRNCRAFERYASYAAVAQSDAKPTLPLDLGIRLPHHLRAIVDKQMPQSLPKAS